MKKNIKAFIVAFCFIFLMAWLPIDVVSEYLANESGDVTSGTPESNRIYTIYVPGSASKVFDVQNALTNDNSIVWTYPYNGDECQEWRFIRQGTDYAIQDSHSGKYLTVKGNSSSADAELVISSRPSSGFSNGQLFCVEQIGTGIRYRIYTKSSDYTLAIGYNSSGYLRQLSSSADTTEVYLTESGPYHGLQEGFVHLQRYNTVYATDDDFLGYVLSSDTLLYSEFNSTATFEWLAVYRGDGYFSFSQNGCYLCCSGTAAGATVSMRSGFSESYCLWKVINNNGYYQLAPKTAVSSDTVSAVLSANSNSPVLVASGSQNGRWRVIRSRYYYRYDMSVYAAEDFSHNNSHADIFNYACSALYKRNGDNQNLIFTTAGTPDIVASDITDLLLKSKIFVLRSHGSPTSFILNARDGNGNNIGTTVTYNLSLINNMSSEYLKNLDCALFLSCHSAEGAYTSSSSSNFVKAVVDKGAYCAIGFDGSVACQKASTFAQLFFEYYANNTGTNSSVIREAFNYIVEETADWNTEYYKPYYYNGYYGIKVD